MAPTPAVLQGYVRPNGASLTMVETDRRPSQARAYLTTKERLVNQRASGMKIVSAEGDFRDLGARKASKRVLLS